MSLQLLTIIFGSRQVIYIISRYFISQLRQTVLISETFFQLAGTLGPVNIYIVSAGQFVCHTCRFDFKVHQVAVRFQCIDEIDVACAIRSQTHSHAAVRLVHCFKEIILCLDRPFLVIEVKVHRSIITVEQYNRCLFILCHVLFQCS